MNSRRPKPPQSVPNSNDSAAALRSLPGVPSALQDASKSYERNLVFSGDAPSKVRVRSVELYASAATGAAAALLYASISASSSSAVGLARLPGLSALPW